MDYLPYRMGYLTPEMALKAKVELGETEEVRKSSVMELKSLISGEPNWRLLFDDEELLQYLRARKFNAKRAFQLLQVQYKEMKISSDVFAVPTFSDFLQVISDGIASLLPCRDREGCITVLFKCSLWNDLKDIISTEMVLHTVAMLAVVSAFDPASQVCGVRYICDMQNSSLILLRYIKSLRLIHLGLVAPWKKVPIRVKRFHILRHGLLFRYAWNVSKFLFSEKMRSRMHFHDTIEDLHQHFDRNILPIDYGGKVDDRGFTLSLIDKEFENRYRKVLHSGYF